MTYEELEIAKGSKSIPKRHKLAWGLLCLMSASSLVELVHITIHEHIYCAEHQALEEPHHEGHGHTHHHVHAGSSDNNNKQQLAATTESENQHIGFDAFLLRSEKGIIIKCETHQQLEAEAKIDDVVFRNIVSFNILHKAPKASPPFKVS
ncbi:MAG: hypothetical protein CMP10_01520 [Zetaproteobacteria bacterium]|nr:hypothetical protein [Pseudobdellovibrionaceae bacterium]